MKNVIIFLFVTGLAVFGLAEKARAYPITIYIEAEVDYVIDYGAGDGYLDGQVQIGDIITGYYTYESTTQDSSPSDPVVGRYWHYASPCGVYLSVGGFEFSTYPSNDPTDAVFLVGIGDTSTHDIYWIHSYKNLALSNGSLVGGISWQLDDYTGSVFSEDKLLLAAPDLTDWQTNVLSFGADRAYGIQAHVTSATPEPMTILLFGLGGLFLKRRV